MRLRRYAARPELLAEAARGRCGDRRPLRASRGGLWGTQSRFHAARLELPDPCPGCTPEVAGSDSCRPNGLWSGWIVEQGQLITEQAIAHLRVLIADQRQDRLERLARLVVGLGHEVVANEIEIRTLAALMVQIGAVRAIELDINAEWPSFIGYARRGGRDPVKLVPNPQQSAYRYLASDNRDFLAIYTRAGGGPLVPFR